MCRSKLLFSTETHVLDRRILVIEEKNKYKRIENCSIELDFRLHDFEIFMDFWGQFAIPILFSFTAVAIVILVIISDLTATLKVALS